MLKEKSKKPSSKEQSTKVKELQALTLADLDAISGTGLRISGLSVNHNETITTTKKSVKPIKKLDLKSLEKVAAAGDGSFLGGIEIDS